MYLSAESACERYCIYIQEYSSITDQNVKFSVYMHMKILVGGRSMYIAYINARYGLAVYGWWAAARCMSICAWLCINPVVCTVRGGVRSVTE